MRFIFGIDATTALYEIAESLPESAWKELHRRPKYEVKTQPRRRPENVKQQIVEEREFEDIRLVKEYVAEFSYRPAKCRHNYRVIVVWKESGSLPWPAEALRRLGVLLLHHQRLGNAHRRGGVRGQRPLQSGEPLAATQERRAFAFGPGGQPG